MAHTGSPIPKAVLVPIPFSFQTLEVGWSFGHVTPAGTRIAECVHPVPPRPRRHIDPWGLRDKFVRLNRSEPRLLEFLHEAGYWTSTGGGSLVLPGSQRPSVDAHPVSDFWKWQDICRQLMKDPPGFWCSTYPRLSDDNKSELLGLRRVRILLFGEGGSHQASTLVFGALKSILVSIYLDLLHHAKFKECARPDCAAVFRIESRHKRKYCSQYCGHLESVRRNRR